MYLAYTPVIFEKPEFLLIVLSQKQKLLNSPDSNVLSEPAYLSFAQRNYNNRNPKERQKL
jgi:hypothetical protein